MLSLHYAALTKGTHMATTDMPKGETTTVDRLASGLRGHINRFSHVVINVSDLDRSVEFYEKTFPVRRRDH